MKLLIQANWGRWTECFCIEAERSDTIGHVKELMSDREGISRLDQRLSYSWRTLEDSKTLADYDIQNMSTIRLVYQLSNGNMRVLIKTPDGEAFKAVVYDSDTVGDLKAQIQQRKGIPVNRQRIMISDLELHDNLSLIGRGVENEVILHLRVRDDVGDKEASSKVKEREKLADQVLNFTTALEGHLQEYKDKLSEVETEVKRLSEENARLKKELDVERSTGAFFLQSEAGHQYLVDVERQAEEIAVDEFKKSTELHELVMYRAMDLYDDAMEARLRELRESSYVSNGVIESNDFQDGEEYSDEDDDEDDESDEDDDDEESDEYSDEDDDDDGYSDGDRDEDDDEYSDEDDDDGSDDEEYSDDDDDDDSDDSDGDGDGDGKEKNEGKETEIGGEMWIIL